LEQLSENFQLSEICQKFENQLFNVSSDLLTHDFNRGDTENQEMQTVSTVWNCKRLKPLFDAGMLSLPTIKIVG
jgi:hypothetical protein